MMTWVGGMVYLFFCLTVMMMMMTIMRAVLIKRFQKKNKKRTMELALPALLCSAALGLPAHLGTCYRPDNIARIVGSNIDSSLLEGSYKNNSSYSISLIPPLWCIITQEGKKKQKTKITIQAEA